MEEHHTFTIRCDAARRQYTLWRGDRGGVECFSTALAALEHASTLVDRVTEVTVCDADGKAVFTTAVYPVRPPPAP